MEFSAILGNIHQLMKKSTLLVHHTIMAIKIFFFKSKTQLNKIRGFVLNSRNAKSFQQITQIDHLVIVTTRIIQEVGLLRHQTTTKSGRRLMNNEIILH